MISENYPISYPSEWMQIYLAMYLSFEDKIGDRMNPKIKQKDQSMEKLPHYICLAVVYILSFEVPNKMRCPLYFTKKELIGSFSR